MTIVTTNNSLADIINWLKNGHIVCIYTLDTKLYFFSKEILDKIEDEIIIYVNVSRDTSLLDEDEWPWYIKNEGFTLYKSIQLLPTNKEHIYIFNF